MHRSFVLTEIASELSFCMLAADNGIDLEELSEALEDVEYKAGSAVVLRVLVEVARPDE